MAYKRRHLRHFYKHNLQNKKQCTPEFSSSLLSSVLPTQSNLVLTKMLTVPSTQLTKSTQISLKQKLLRANWTLRNSVMSSSREPRNTCRERPASILLMTAPPSSLALRSRTPRAACEATMARLPSNPSHGTPPLE